MLSCIAQRNWDTKFAYIFFDLSLYPYTEKNLMPDTLISYRLQYKLAILSIAILAAENNKKFNVYNVGTGKNYTLNELVGILNRHLNKKHKA